MTQANELRIGNFVKRKGEPIYILGETPENSIHRVN
jgi:hypothetical protein